MLVHAPSLYLAAAILLLLAGGSSLAVVLRQRERRGDWYWTGAQAALAAGLLALTVDTRPATLVPAAALLAAQWPLVTLAGIRRFYSRGADGVPAWCDWGALGLMCTLVGGLWAAPLSLAGFEMGYAGGMLFTTLYASFAVWKLEDFSANATLKTALTGLLAAAAAQLAWPLLAAFVVAAPDAPIDFLAAPFLAMAALGMLMTQLSLVMHHERSIAQMRASQRKLRRLVEVDPLTQLPNRAHFHKLAEKAVRAQPDAACVLVFDVDRLQKINELLGHASGDEALRQIGTALRETLRRRDVAGRLGGDEFGVVLPRTKLADAEAVVARLNARIDDRQVAPRIARVVLNAGGTQMRAGETVADALRRAEITRDSKRDEGRLQLADTLPTAGREQAQAVAAAAVALAAAEDSGAPTPALAYMMPMDQLLSIQSGDVALVTP